MAAEARARIERHEAERLRRGGVDDFPHVDVEAMAHQRDLVDEPDVDRAERVFEQLHHFGDARVADLDHLVDDLPVERRGQVGARLVDSADDFRNILRRVGLVARIDALGRKREIEIACPPSVRRPRAPAAPLPRSSRDRSSTRE